MRRWTGWSCSSFGEYMINELHLGLEAHDGKVSRWWRIVCCESGCQRRMVNTGCRSSGRRSLRALGGIYRHLHVFVFNPSVGRNIQSLPTRISLELRINLLPHIYLVVSALAIVVVVGISGESGSSEKTTGGGGGGGGEGICGEGDRVGVPEKAFSCKEASFAMVGSMDPGMRSTFIAASAPCR